LGTASSQALARMLHERLDTLSAADDSATLPEPTMEYKRTVLKMLYDTIAPIRDAGGRLTPRMQELLRRGGLLDGHTEGVHSTA
jgi:hypothetical protein